MRHIWGTSRNKNVKNGEFQEGKSKRYANYSNHMMQSTDSDWLIRTQQLNKALLVKSWYGLDDHLDSYWHNHK